MNMSHAKAYSMNFQASDPRFQWSFTRFCYDHNVPVEVAEGLMKVAMQNVIPTPSIQLLNELHKVAYGTPAKSTVANTTHSWNDPNPGAYKQTDPGAYDRFQKSLAAAQQSDSEYFTHRTNTPDGGSIVNTGQGVITHNADGSGVMAKNQYGSGSVINPPAAPPLASQTPAVAAPTTEGHLGSQPPPAPLTPASTMTQLPSTGNLSAGGLSKNPAGNPLSLSQSPLTELGSPDVPSTPTSTLTQLPTEFGMPSNGKQPFKSILSGGTSDTMGLKSATVVRALFKTASLSPDSLFAPGTKSTMSFGSSGTPSPIKPVSPTITTPTTPSSTITHSPGLPDHGSSAPSTVSKPTPTPSGINSPTLASSTIKSPAGMTSPPAAVTPDPLRNTPEQQGALDDLHALHQYQQHRVKEFRTAGDGGGGPADIKRFTDSAAIDAAATSAMDKKNQDGTYNGFAGGARLLSDRSNANAHDRATDAQFQNTFKSLHSGYQDELPPELNERYGINMDTMAMQHQDEKGNLTDRAVDPKTIAAARAFMAAQKNPQGAPQPSAPPAPATPMLAKSGGTQWKVAASPPKKSFTDPISGKSFGSLDAMNKADPNNYDWSAATPAGGHTGALAYTPSVNPAALQPQSISGDKAISDHVALRDRVRSEAIADHGGINKIPGIVYNAPKAPSVPSTIPQLAGPVPASQLSAAAGNASAPTATAGGPKPQWHARADIKPVEGEVRNSWNGTSWKYQNGKSVQLPDRVDESVPTANVASAPAAGAGSANSLSERIQASPKSSLSTANGTAKLPILTSYKSPSEMRSLETLGDDLKPNPTWNYTPKSEPASATAPVAAAPANPPIKVIPNNPPPGVVGTGGGVGGGVKA